MLAALASLGSMAMSGLSTAGSWIGSNLGGIGQALGGLGGVVGSLFGSSSSSKKSQKLAAKQAALQWEYQKKAWLEGYRYQRQGLEDAGYNPMLALGGASANSFTPSSMPSAPVPDIVGGAKAGGELLKSISELTKLEVEEKKATIDNIESSTLKNNVGTVVGGVSDAARVVADVATARAVGKAAEAVKNNPSYRNRAILKEAKTISRSATKAGKGASSVLSTLSKVAPFLVPMAKGSALGAAALGAGYGAYKLATRPYKEGSNAKKIVDTPNYGSRLR